MMVATRSHSAMDGTGLPKEHARLVMDLAIGTVRVTGKLLEKMLDCISASHASPVPPRVLLRYGPRIEFVHNALQANDYEPCTIAAYTHVVGEMLLWVDKHAGGDLTPDNVCSFLEHYVSRGRKRAELRLGTLSDETGRGVRYLAYHALRTVLDTLLGMELTGACPRPGHPPPTAPASQASVQQLFGVAETDRELLLLIMTNGLKLRPSQSAALEWHSLSPDCRWLMVFTCKGVQTIEIDGRFRPILASLRERSRRYGFMFPSPRGNGAKPVSVRTLQNVLARMIENAGIQERVTLTSLRRAGVHVPPGASTENKARCPCIARTDGKAEPRRRTEISAENTVHLSGKIVRSKGGEHATSLPRSVADKTRWDRLVRHRAISAMMVLLRRCLGWVTPREQLTFSMSALW